MSLVFPDPGKFRRKAIVTGKGPRPLPFIAPFSDTIVAPEGNDGLPDVIASGGSVTKTSTINTINFKQPRGLRVMSWNLQDLGGGPSRGPRRAGEVIDRIARIILESDADICVILEVKRRVWIPPKPVEPVPPRSTRALKKKGMNALKEEFDLRLQKYKVKLKEWEKRNAEAQKTPAKDAPGLAELDRIVDRMNALSLMSGTKSIYARLKPELSQNPEDVFTEGETYGFIYDTEVVASGEFRLLVRDDEGKAMYWPEKGYRAPAMVTFTLYDYDQTVPVVAFHAPAPHHGDITHRAIKQFQNMKWPSDTIVAGDFNVDTEAEDIDTSDRALSTLLAFFEPSGEQPLSIEGVATGTITDTTQHVPQLNAEEIWLTGMFGLDWWEPDYDQNTIELEAAFKGWFTRATQTTEAAGTLDLRIAAPRIRILPANIHSSHLRREHDWLQDPESTVRKELRDLASYGDRGLGLDQYSISAGNGETSLRKKVQTRKFDCFSGVIGRLYSADVLNNAGYDKLFVRTTTLEDDWQFKPIGAWDYPLVERCLPLYLRQVFRMPVITTAPPPFLPDDTDSMAKAAAAIAARKEITDQFDDDDDDEDYEPSPVKKVHVSADKDAETVKVALQEVLDVANAISDHVPLILDVVLR